MKKDIKAELVKLITDKIDTDKILPWDKGTLNNKFFPRNWKTEHNYRGVNALLLSCLGSGLQEYLTFKQVVEAGGKVKKGAKSFPIIFWSTYIPKGQEEDQQDEDEEIRPRGFWKKYNVFQVGEQTEGIEPKREMKTQDNERREDVDSFIAKFAAASGVKVKEISGQTTACYIPSLHEVHIAPVNEYKSTEAWIATLLHELVHSTGPKMGRKMGAKFGSEKYSKEEVIAEFGAALLCREFGITCQEDNTAAYLQNWSQKLKENPDWLINGANAAQKAVDYMLGTTTRETKEAA